MAENEYFSSILERLQNKIFAFMDDVRRRTRIFEGRRSVEEQLSSEYHGRFLIELIQNADDACGVEGEIAIVIRQETYPGLFVFNTGKGFTSGNFESLCTLGLTDKKPEEAIGNKGLGFRSVLEVCDYPLIFSSNPYRIKDTQPCFDGYCFGFAPNALRDGLQKTAEQIIAGNGLPKMEIIGRHFELLETTESTIIDSLKNSLKDPEILKRAIKTLPVYEMPLPIMTHDPLLDWAGKKNLSTGVFLKIRLGTEEVLQKALAELDSYTFLFLRNARYISIYLTNTECDDPYKLIEFERNIPPSAEAVIRKGHVKITYYDKDVWAAICGIKREDLTNDVKDWLFFRKPIIRTEFETTLGDLPERWQEIKQVEIELAVPIKASSDSGKFAIYLPTKADTGTGAWINAPFYGKIDRTGIDWNRKWNSFLLGQAIACVGKMVNILRQSTDVESGQAILHLLGIIEKNHKLADAQITSEFIQHIIKDEAWVLSEQNTKGEASYIKLSDLALAGDFAWKVNPVEPIMDIVCRERIPIIFTHPELAQSHENILKNTANLYDASTKKPLEQELALLAETAIHKIDKEKRDSEWWNNLYRWLGHLDISYKSLVGKRLIWTQSGIYKVQQESNIFSPPRRLVATDEESNPMIKKFQEILTSSLPDAFEDRVAFLHPEIDLTDKFIRSFLIRGSGNTVVREFRTDQVADFILNQICRALYRDKMSKKRRKEAAEIFAWTFVLWRQMRGEGQSVDWSKLIIPTSIGWRPANETYAGRHWLGNDGADLEKVFLKAQHPKPFVTHPNNLVLMLPQTYQDLIKEYNLQDDLNQFILDALKVWTAPRLFIQKATRPGGYNPEFCPNGSDNSLDTSTLRNIPENFKIPVDKETWDKYLQKIELESKGRPFQMYAKYVLKEIAYIEDVKISEIDHEAFARSLGRGWSKYYSAYATTTVQRHPQDYGERKQWNVTGFVVEQLINLKWLPMSVWATRVEEGRESTREFDVNVTPQEVLKVNKDLLQSGSGLIYSLLPHIEPNVEPIISEELCQKIGIVLYSPQERYLEAPFHIMQLLYQAHNYLPRGREHLLLSLWQDMFDAAVSRVAIGKWPAVRPSAALGFELQRDGSRRLCWLHPVKEDAPETYTAWISDNEDSLSMLPAGTFIACTGKRKTRLNDRVTLLKQILTKIDVRRLSELKTIHVFDPLDAWETPRLLSDTFPWLIQPALAVLAFGRQTSQPMSVSNPKGDFPPLVSRIQSAHVQYVRNLKIGLEGLTVEPAPRSIFYSNSENLFLLDIDAQLRLRNMAAPLTLLFDREDYLKPAELWLMKVEEASEDNNLREAVPLEIAIEKLGIETASLQELFQVIGGETQQIIRSVAPALYATIKQGESPFPPYELNNIVSKIADVGNAYDHAEKSMLGILTKAGVSDAAKYSNVLRQIVQQKRDPSGIAKTVYDLLKIDLGDWNVSAVEIGSRGQTVSHREAMEAFNKMKQDVRWAACGFLQKYLQDVRKTEFMGRWESYDLVMPSDSIHLTWSLNFAQIELPIIEWFKKQATDLVGGLDVFDQDTSDILEVIRQKYGHLGKDPDTILNDNVKALNSRWRRLWIVLASIALRGLDKDVLLTQLQNIDEEAPGKWAMEDERHQTTLCVAVASEDELFALLCEWINTQAVAIKKKFEGVKANTLDVFIKNNQVTPEEEKMAEENLKKGPIVVPKRTIGRKPLEIPEQDKPLDALRKKLDELLSDNNQEILNRLTEDVNLDICANLGDAPLQRSPKKHRGGKAPGPKEKDKNFIGYVGEYLIYRALKKRYPHIGLSAWVSGNKQKFFPGSQGNDSLGYDFCLSVGGHNVLIEVKSHIGDQNYFDLGPTELDAAQEALETGTFYQVWVVRNLEGIADIDHIPNPMTKENRKHFRFEIGRVYYKKE